MFKTFDSILHRFQMMLIGQGVQVTFPLTFNFSIANALYGAHWHVLLRFEDNLTSMHNSWDRVIFQDVSLLCLLYYICHIRNTSVKLGDQLIPPGGRGAETLWVWRHRRGFGKSNHYHTFGNIGTFQIQIQIQMRYFGKGNYHQTFGNFVTFQKQIQIQISGFSKSTPNQWKLLWSCRNLV